MIFNSIDYAFFLPIVFLMYWFVFNRNLKLQNAFLLLSSYFFYGYWHPKFLLLILFSTLINYSLGRLISEIQQNKKQWLVVGILSNLLLLGVFKYYNFFIENLIVASKIFGFKLQIASLQLILPIGISFYTFQCIAYLVDVYKKDVNASKNLLNFSLFIAFFPQLVAGPIERASNLLKQVNSVRVFNSERAITGLKLIVLGLFEKIVIADTCAQIVNPIFDSYQEQSASTLFVGALLFSFQIYGDFCGYSHIAIGSANLLGFNLTKNFNYPYLAKNIADFWRRWHISFSIWLRDYIYYPLGGSKKGEFIKIRNLTIVFLISGIWHGADWTFVIYGCIHAILYILYIYYTKYLKKYLAISLIPSKLSDFIAILSTFVILSLARVFFRAENLPQALGYFEKMLTLEIFSKPNVSRLLVILLFGFVMLEYFQRKKEYLLEFSIKNRLLNYLFYSVVLITILYYYGEYQEFIYFQF